MPLLGVVTFQIMAVSTGFALSCLKKGMPFRSIATYLFLGAVASLLGFLPGKHETNYVLYHHLVAYPVILVVVSAGIAWFKNRDQLSIHMTEGDLYLLTLTFCYSLTPWNTGSKILAVLFAVPVLGVISSCFLSLQLGPRLRFWLGIWALVASGIICLRSILGNFNSLSLDITQVEPSLTGFLTRFLVTAMTSASLAFLIFNLSPLVGFLQGKNESREAYQIRMKSQAVPFIQNRIMTVQVPLQVTLFISLLHGLPLLINFVWQLAPFHLALTYALVVSPMLTFSLANLLFPPIGHATSGPEGRKSA